MDALALRRSRQVVRNKGHVCVRDVGKRFGNAVGSVVMKESMPCRAVLATGDEDRHFGVTIGSEFGHNLKDGSVDSSIGTFAHIERNLFEWQIAPLS